MMKRYVYLEIGSSFQDPHLSVGIICICTSSDFQVIRFGGPLHVVQWVALLIQVAFLRVHPFYQPGDLDQPGMLPVPDCVHELVAQCIFPLAAADASVEDIVRLRSDAAVQVRPV